MASVYFTTLITAILLISSTQAKPQLEENAIVEELQKWAKEKLLGAIDELKKAEQDLKDTVTAALDKSRQELETEYASSLIEYHTHKEKLHPKCFQDGLTYLTSYEPVDLPTLDEVFAVTSNDNSTTPKPPNCVTEAIKDVGLMLYSIAKYIASILNTMDDIINGYTLCSQGHWWKKFTCLFTYVGTAVSDVYHTLSGIGDLIADLTSYGADMTKQINNCTHPKKLEIRQQLFLALENAHKCTKLH